MSTRTEFAAVSIVTYYRQHQRAPDVIKMHPVFRRAVEGESPYCFDRTNFFGDGRDAFMGIEIEICSDIHSCECTAKKVLP